MWGSKKPKAHEFTGYVQTFNNLLISFDLSLRFLILFPLDRFMGDLSEEQEQSLQEFKRYLKENDIAQHPLYDDYYLLRFLRARKFDMDKTKLMFNNFLDWRKQNDVDNIIEVSSQSVNILLKK